MLSCNGLGPVSIVVLGGIVISVLAIGPKIRGFKPGRCDGFLRAIKICSTSSFGGEARPSALCRHVRDPFKGRRDTLESKINFLLQFLLLFY
jgi:hypothetical protein